MGKGRLSASTSSPRPKKMQRIDAEEPAPTPPTNEVVPAIAPLKKRLSLGSALEKNGVKKLTLKSKPRLSTTPQDALTFATQSVATLSRAIRAIQARPPQSTPESLQSLYALCEGAVAGGKSTGQLLYDRIRMEIERQAGEIRKDLLKGEGDDGDKSEERWLQGLEGEWKGFLNQMLLIRSIFLHLDRTFVLQSAGLLSIWDLGLDIFRHSVIENEAVSQRITTCFIAVINRERDGDVIPRPLIRSLVGLLQALSEQTHQALFVTPFLAASKPYYHDEGIRLAGEMESTDYLKRILARLAEEGERCDSVLGSGLKGSILRVVLDEMVSIHVEAIVEKSLGPMIAEDRKEDLSSVYSLLARVSSLAVLKKAFLEYVKAAGLAIVMDKASDEKMVNVLIAYRQKVVAIVKECFGLDQSFQQAQSQAFEFFINKRENKPAEMMAKYLDAKLRSGNKGMADEDLENTLNDVLALFRFTQGKDIFEAFYKRDLAKRLLLNKSASFDAERSMLIKLKDECGPGFTAKLEIMFKDIDLSSDVMRAYSTKSNDANNVDLYVNVLSMGNWPSYPPVNVRIPESMVKNLERFKAFYTSKHSGRTLQWQHSLDHCTLKAAFPIGGKKELAVSLFQALILLLFNEVPKGGVLSFNEIVEATRIDPKEASRTLQSLACGKVRVLTKSPKGREVATTDEFSFNSDFKDDHVKIKINQIQQKETAEENKSTTDRVFTDRSSHLQLAIVRIMKARKTLKYSELVMEVVSQVGHRFKVETAEIKKSMDSLIDREYLRRAEDQQNVFEYLA